MSFYFIYSNSEVFLCEGEDGFSLPAEDHFQVQPLQKYLVGQWQGRECWAADIEEARPSGEFRPVGLRSLFGILSDELISLLHLGSQVVTWSTQHQFCGRCGAKTREVEGESWSMKCDSCGLTAFPRVSPAAIVLVRKGNEFLLARNKRFKRDFFSALAGFVDPGESLEQTVSREVKEEVGIEVSNIRYFGSQPWPFPHSLMIGFLADYSSGDVQVDDDEIAEAKWFNASNLPKLPPKYSIARQMIDHVCS